jgi:hypothetical protein
MAESVLGPSGSGSVVLDLGPDTGALVLHTPPELDSREIEISRRADGAPRSRTHSRVRQRHTPGGVQYAAVYPDLAAGEYLVWRDTTTSAMIVTIAGGQVTTAYWPGPQPMHWPGHEGSPGPG